MACCYYLNGLRGKHGRTSGHDSDQQMTGATRVLSPLEEAKRRRKGCLYENELDKPYVEIDRGRWQMVSTRSRPRRDLADWRSSSPSMAAYVLVLEACLRCQLALASIYVMDCGGRVRGERLCANIYEAGRGWGRRSNLMFRSSERQETASYRA